VSADPHLTSAAPAARRPSVGYRILGVIGEVMMTLGALLLLFVAYQLWWTNVEAERQTAQAATQLQRQWVRTTAPTTAPKSTEPTSPSLGTAFALAWIPRLKDKVWGLPINEGVGMDELARGLGHYPETAMPGEIGNFAIAGHRATNGEPLRNIDLLEKGDEVIIETSDAWYTYRLDHDKIVTPDAVWVVEPVPGRPDDTPTEALITVTTCNPRWASYERWIWWGVLESHIDKSTGKVPEAVAAD
jgi:sortase A